MKRTSFLKSAALAALLAVSGASLAGTSTFLQKASIKKLDAAGYLMHGVKDAYALQNILGVINDRAGARFDELEEYLADRGMFEELEDIRHLRDLLELAELEIVELVPLGPGAEGQDPLADLERGLPDSAWVPTLPDGGGFASTGVPWQYSGGYKGYELWTRSYEDDAGDAHYEEQVRDPLTHEVVREIRQVQARDHSVTTTYLQHFVDEEGKRRVTVDVVHTDADGNDTYLVENVTVQDSKGGEDVEAPKLDVYQPADGSSGVFCPLELWQCRAALAKAKKKGSSAVILRGSVRVNPDRGADLSRGGLSDHAWSGQGAHRRGGQTDHRWGGQTDRVSGGGEPSAGRPS